MGKKKKRYKRFVFRFFFFSIILCYLVMKGIPIVLSSSNKTNIAEYGEIKIVQPIKGYVIRNERMIRCQSEGEIKYFVQDGEKVEKGYKIVEISNQKIDDTTRKKLQVVNERIGTIQKDENHLFENDLEKLTTEIDTIIKEIKQYKEEGDLQKVEACKKTLMSKLQKKKLITGDYSFAGQNLKLLKNQQDQLEQKISQSVSVIKSPQSGVISYHIDGYENVLNPSNMATIDLNSIQKIEPKISDLRTQKVIQHQPIFKIVDNSHWYIVSWIKDLKYYKEGRKVTFKFPQRNIEGTIEKIIQGSKNNMIVFGFDEYAEKFYDLRNVDVKAIIVHYEGLKIDKSSIVEQDGKKGVYALDINRYTHFKPIKVKGYDEDYAIIESNTFFEKKGDEVKEVRTVKLYDEIVANGSETKEGQIIY